MVIGVNGRLLYQDTLEGIHRYVYETTVHMARMHPETTFIVYLDRKTKTSLPYPANIQFKTINLPTRHPLLWLIWFELLLPIHLYLDKVDVFYSGDGFLSLLTQKPQVLVTHDLAFCHYPEHIPFFHLWYHRRFIKRFHKKAKDIIAVSHATKEDIIKQFGVHRNKITVAYNAVNHGVTKSEDFISDDVFTLVHDGNPYFFSIGAIHPRKNIKRICEAFSFCKKKYSLPHKLVIAGRFAWKSSRIKKEMESTPGVVFIGSINDAEKSYLYQHATALLYISLFEGFGIPILEAMRAGCPVVTSSTSSMPEVAGNAAILADPLDIQSISDAIYRMTNPEEREFFIRLGSERVQEFAWENTAEIIYRKLTGQVSFKQKAK